MGDTTELILNWRSVLLAMIMFPALLLCIALAIRSIERKASFWLIAFIVVVVLSGLPFLIGFAGAYDIWPELTFLPVQLPTLFGALLYFHIHYLLTEEPLNKKVYLIFPGIVDLLYQNWAFWFLGDYKNKWAFSENVHVPYIVPLQATISIVLFLIAVILIVKLQRRYKAWLGSIRSDDFDFDPVWLKHFLVILSVAGVVWVVSVFLIEVYDLNYIDQFWFLIICHFSVLILAIEALSCLQSNYPKLSKLQTEHISPDVIQTKFKDWTKESSAIKAAVLSHNWHLEVGFTLKGLAKRYGMNQTYVSRAINQGLNLSFSDFINQLRIEHAMHLLETGELKILDVALASGFGSKASFNRVFKHYTQQTPSTFKKTREH